MRYYAEHEGLPSEVADNVAQEATTLFLNFCRQRRKEGRGTKHMKCINHSIRERG
jgi:hypothetical protein